MDPDFVDALNLVLILHADHGQNCSTSAVRMVGSSDVNLFSAISAGICACGARCTAGPTRPASRCSKQIIADNRNLGKYIDRAKDPNDPFRSWASATGSTRTTIRGRKVIKDVCHRLLIKHGAQDPIFELAQELEEVALKDPYFIERKLYPNVDFYSGIIYRLMGIPKNMFTVLFALGRLPGWIAHWLEMHHSPNKRIHRPRQLYVGSAEREFVPLVKRMPPLPKEAAAPERRPARGPGPARDAGRRVDHQHGDLSICRVGQATAQSHHWGLRRFWWDCAVACPTLRCGHRNPLGVRDRWLPAQRDQFGHCRLKLLRIGFVGDLAADRPGRVGDPIETVHAGRARELMGQVVQQAGVAAPLRVLDALGPSRKLADEGRDQGGRRVGVENASFQQALGPGGRLLAGGNVGRRSTACPRCRAS